MSFAQIVVLIALMVTLGILLTGVISMARGGEFNEKYGNKLMRMRIISQLTALILIAIFAFLSGD
ncbi:MAG: twin transmembrane helix small protein [Proteobacteria bacterium]|nr:twin transmembrane helix small protein [Pseudomonadota bacterium]MCH7805650.1 twin transmembrane helix small protein [Pseudomonadota bacterium]MCH8080824.1 twin transmembrane helix small protein [Pseudomonadota bacterium]MCH8172100.1 twin transmembrane helix small protein [Pseudomonadota bacterium]MCH8321477.1 twin transmembrane helix small protein [Pseudomonadota bacterium]